MTHQKLIIILFMSIILAGCGKKIEGKYVSDSEKTSTIFEFISPTEIYAYNAFNSADKRKYTYKINGDYLEINNGSETDIFDLKKDGSFGKSKKSFYKFKEYEEQLCDSLEDAKSCNRCKKDDSRLRFRVDVDSKTVEVISYEPDGSEFMRMPLYGSPAYSCSFKDKENWECKYGSEDNINALANGVYYAQYGRGNYTCALTRTKSK